MDRTITLDSMTDENVVDIAPCLLAYGPEGVGKSTLFATAPDVAFIRIAETPPDGYRPMGWTIKTYGELIQAIGLLYSDEHKFRFLVIDSVTRLEQRIIWPEVCRRGEKGAQVENIEDFGFGKGYKLAMGLWEEIFEGLDGLRHECGIGIGLIGHSVIRDFNDPESQAYSVFDVDLQDGKNVSAARFVKQRADAVLFIKPEVNVEKEDPGNKFNKRVIAKGGALRKIYTEGRPAFAAKNRFNMPASFIFKRENGFNDVAKHIPFFSAPADVEQAA